MQGLPCLSGWENINTKVNLNTTMYLVDSHCHLDRLDLESLGGDLDAVMVSAEEHGVGRMLCVSINLEHLPAVLDLAHRYEHVYASVGVHPSERDGAEPAIDELVTLADDPQVIAIGETGLDYYYNEGDLGWQRDRFRRHIAAALETGLPLIVHTRDSQEDTLKILAGEGARRVSGVMHCFTGDWETAQAAMELGFYISFSGIVTFKNAAQLREVARQMPQDRILVETDSPYLTPVPYRGKPNQPAYVRYVAEQIASLRDMSLEQIARQTTENFNRLFKL